jgi:hypothetical protein
LNCQGQKDEKKRGKREEKMRKRREKEEKKKRKRGLFALVLVKELIRWFTRF